jgi:hypothetical protein
MLKPKDALMILGLAANACAPGLSATSAPLASPPMASETLEPKPPRAPDSMPFSMMGAPQEEVAQKTRKLLALLGPFPKLGTQADGSIVECEVAPVRDMAMSMAITNILQTLRDTPVAPEISSTPAPKPDKLTNFPQIVLKGGSSEELTTGEFLSCIQAQRNPDAKSH